jgi:nickel/cobalt transporter (NiCoT) family protein
MSDLPTDFSALCAVVFLLGMRHGLDADHLAAIDGLTRMSSRRREPWARYCGALFSVGHGIVVISIAAFAGLLGARWAPPGWFETLGAWISIGFLAALGIVNLRALVRAAPDAPVPLVGVRGRLVERLLARFGRTPGAFAVMAVGTLFALSFDTLSQAALFAVMGSQYGGLEHALTLGALFMLGMLAADGANGWWVSRLVDRTDRMAVLASRTMTVAVSCVSLLVAGLGAARMLWAEFDGWTDGKELAIGGATIVLMTSSYLLACRLARSAKARPAHP